MALLHKTLAENLLLRIQDPEAKSADLNVARQFLKDNGIDALPVEGSPLSDLVATLPVSMSLTYWNVKHPTDAQVLLCSSCSIRDSLMRKDTLSRCLPNHHRHTHSGGP